LTTRIQGLPLYRFKLTTVKKSADAFDGVKPSKYGVDNVAVPWTRFEREKLPVEGIEPFPRFNKTIG
jgi:hypothetical protein